MTELTYRELVHELFSRLTGGIRWGVERTERLLAAVGDPHRRYRTIHLAGTNGKGSTAATLASILRESGVRTGLYTSPHLCTFRERIQVDGLPVTEEAILAAARPLWPHISREAPSFFEATTAIAFQAFADAGIEAAVVEVGLGGRLDATNVVVPEVVVLTCVARDHEEFLGGTLEEIAGEKAGVLKPAIPAVTLEQAPGVLDVFRQRAATVGAPLHLLEDGRLDDVRVGLDGTRFRLRTGVWGDLELHTPLIGRHQARNTALAVAALEHLAPELRPAAEAVVRGVARVRWPGRLQRVRTAGGPWVFDAAHNPAGIAALVEALGSLSVPHPLIAVVGILSDKDWMEMLPPLLGLVDLLILTVPPSAPEHRRWNPEAAAAAIGSERVSAVLPFEAALEAAHRRAAGGAVLVTGSFHTVGDAMCVLGLAPHGVDPILPALAMGA